MTFKQQNVVTQDQIADQSRFIHELTVTVKIVTSPRISNFISNTF